MKKNIYSYRNKFFVKWQKIRNYRRVRGDVFLAKDLSFEGVTEKFKLNDLLKQLEVGNLIFAVRKKQSKTNQSKVADFSMLPAELQVEAKFRYEAIKPLIDLNVQKSANMSMQERMSWKLKGKKFLERLYIVG